MPMTADAASTGPVPVLAFERRGQVFCCPTADVLEILEEPALDDPGYPTPLVAGVLLYGDRFVAAIDPASIFDHPPERRGDVILIQGPAGVVALLADSVLGFRTPTALAPALWIPAGRICRSAAVIEGIGRAFVLGGDGLGDIPSAAAARPAAADPDRGQENATTTPSAGPMHLIFTVAGRTFAATYTDVIRILYRQRPFRIPGALPPINYAVDVIGAIVPVLDLAEPDVQPALADFVVLTSSVGPLALRVDGIERPLPLVRDVTEPGWFPAPGVEGIARMPATGATRHDRAYSVITGETLLRDLIAGAASREDGSS
jgi:chemotaxis signal transduction protein